MKYPSVKDNCSLVSSFGTIAIVTFLGGKNITDQDYIVVYIAF